MAKYIGNHAYGTCEICGASGKMVMPGYAGDGLCRRCLLTMQLWSELCEPGLGWSAQQWRQWAEANEEEMPSFIAADGTYIAPQEVARCEDCGSTAKICGRTYWNGGGVCRQCWIAHRAKQDQVAREHFGGTGVWTAQEWRKWCAYFDEPMP